MKLIFDNTVHKIDLVFSYDKESHLIDLIYPKKLSIYYPDIDPYHQCETNDKFIISDKNIVFWFHKFEKTWIKQIIQTNSEYIYIWDHIRDRI